MGDKVPLGCGENEACPKGGASDTKFAEKGAPNVRRHIWGEEGQRSE